MEYMRTGKILFVDLTSGDIGCEPTDAYTHRFLGGHGINLKILYDRTGPEVAPLDPANVLIFGSGPFTGTTVPGSGRTAVAAKSPQSGFMVRSNFGGDWSPELKYAGYDHIVVTGRADKPVYIAIDNDRVAIRAADRLWGLDTSQTQLALRKTLNDPETKIVCIGPGGENQVVYATVMSGLGNGGGKTGMGAVMGSKNLKAIAVRGTGGIRIADPEKFMQICQEVDRNLRANPRFERFTTIGTTDIQAQLSQGHGVLGNYQASHWDKLGEADITSFWQQHGHRRAGCFNCPVRCMEYFSHPEIGHSVSSCALYIDPTMGLYNSDTRLWYELNCQFQRYGLDPTATVGMIAWATELYTAGIIDDKDTDGLALVPGSREATVGLVDKIVKRQGLGKLLAGDAKAAARSIGRGAEAYLMHVKGIPLVHTNRFNNRGGAIAAATGNRGDWPAGRSWTPDKVELITEGLPEVEARWAITAFETTLAQYGLDNSSLTWESYEGKAALMALERKLISVTDMLLNCKFHSIWVFGSLGIELQARLLSAGEARECSIDELFTAGERIHAFERAYNLREGLTRADDSLPKRFFEAPMPGFYPHDVLDRQKFEQAKNEYYAAMRWDPETGVPPAATLQALGLDDVAAELEKLDLLPEPRKV